ncbi:MAG: hypothetical protein WDA22_17580 [Bacteroidota bacterium]
MITIFETPIDSPLLISLTVIYIITSSITTFDKRLIQAVKRGDIPANEEMLPTWVGMVAWFHWAVGLSILLLNWQFALIVFIAKFILSVLPVLETIGNVLMSQFRTKK